LSVCGAAMPSKEAKLLGPVVPKPNLPSLVMRMRSLRAAAPSSVVENIRRPGMSLTPGVPSTAARMAAAGMKPTPSENRQVLPPPLSPDDTMPCVPTAAPRDLYRLTPGPPLSADQRAAVTEPAVLGACTCRPSVVSDASGAPMATRPSVRSTTMASFHAEPSGLTLTWKLSSPVSPNSARPELPT
jgi:hypothetical protein